MANLRPAAVAGAFYPSHEEDLARTVCALLDAAPMPPRGLPKAIIVPHAGYRYSGPIAATAYRTLQTNRERIARVILLAPAHRVALRGLALPQANGFATPLGSVQVDQAAYAVVRSLPRVTVNDLPHASEHALEVQLPFLQTVLNEFTFLPLVVGEASAEEIANVLEKVWGGEETLIVISSDLSHYLPYTTAQRRDKATISKVLAMKPELDYEDACGARPLNGFVLAAQRHGLVPTLLDLRNSGDTAGDKNQVVGYAALAFYPELRHAS